MNLLNCGGNKKEHCRGAQTGTVHGQKTTPIENKSHLLKESLLSFPESRKRREQILKAGTSHKFLSTTTPNAIEGLLERFKSKILKPSEELKEVDLMERREECSKWLILPSNE